MHVHSDMIIFKYVLIAVYEFVRCAMCGVRQCSILIYAVYVSVADCGSACGSV
jgi:hypothetical protein